MEQVKDIISIYYVEAIVGLAIGMMALFIMYIVAQHKYRKSKERYNSFMRGLTGVNIEDVLIHINRDIKSHDRDINLIEQNLSDIETRLAFAIQKIGFVRYNAFGGMGSELSFSIALLDNFQNGFVLSSIYGRENSVSYAKPMKDGECRIPLSAEELLAIDRALKGEGLEKSF